MIKPTILACLLLTAATASAQSRPVRSDQEILIQLERDWDRALRRNDDGFISGLLAEEFIVTYGDGTRGDRAKEMTLAREFNQQVDSSTLDDFTVKIYGDTAVVWFTQQMVGPKQGKPVTVTFKYMDVWVLRDGRWLCVGSQSTRVSAP